jgi:protein-S-isoprenylcysteine O-methyltransferase Ste14
MLFVVTATFAIDHFELFGIKQGTGLDIYGKLGISTANKFSTRLHYKLIRHPIMTGFFIMFILCPRMSLNHLIWSVCCIMYILLAVKLFEEPDLKK